MVRKYTKTEIAILVRVAKINALGALCGLGVSPGDTDFNHHEYRFVKRLYDSGEIVYVQYNPKHGAGWALPTTKDNFSPGV